MEAKPEAVAEHFGTSAEHVREIFSADINVTSLESSIDLSESLTVGDTVVDERAPMAETALQEAEMAGLVGTCLIELPPELRAVIEQHFGLNGYAPCALEVVAGRLHLTMMQVHRMQNEGLKRLRRMLQGRGLSEEDLL
jgi:RNA polymerase nonessential primary-like sigma factor